MGVKAVVRIAVLLLITCSARAAEIVFPDDPRAMINLKIEMGAKGDGVADDSDALQNAIERGRKDSRSIYIPNGTYRITRTIVFKPAGEGREGSMIGPWVWGQHRDRTILKLADGAEGFTDAKAPREMIRGVSRPDGARMNADFFDRIMCNLTIDTGNNPGAIGIKYYSNNTGLMSDVLIRGNGECGIDLGFNDQNGPLLIEDVEVDGFAVGIRTSHILNSQTFSRVTVRHAREVGLFHRGQVLAAEGLKIIDAPLAVNSAQGVLCLVDCEFKASKGATGPAIRLDKGHLYAARLETVGFQSALSATNVPAAGVSGSKIREYTSHPAITLGEKVSATGLGMKPKREPIVPFPTRTNDWVCANDFGAKAGDKEDDAPALQQAVDEAANRGASTVYLLGFAGGDPNWYFLKHDVRVHGSVRRIIGFGFVRMFSGDTKAPNYPDNLPRFIVDDDAADVVMFENLHVFAPSQALVIEARSPKRTVVCRSIDGTIVARAKARVFVSNCVGHMYQEKDSTVFARQWNTENGPGGHGVNTRNDGGRLWILGLKTEAKSTKIATLNAGHTKVIGVHNYNTTGVQDETPFFSVEDASLSVAGYREVCFSGRWWKNTVVAKKGIQEFRQPATPWQSWSLLRAESP